MTNLLCTLHVPVAFYMMDNVRLTAAALAAVVMVALILKRRSRRQPTQNASRH